MDKEMTITGDTVKVVPLKYFYFVLKRVADVLISFIGILFLVPLMIFVKVLYLLSGDFHSIFYRQKRLGKHGKEIRIFKFRTMVVNAEEILEDWLKNNPEKRKEYLRDRKIDNDPCQYHGSLRLLQGLRGDEGTVSPDTLQIIKQPVFLIKDMNDNIAVIQ